MRIALVSHGFPPLERSGVENYCRSLARALVELGHQVEVFAPRRAPELPELALRREVREGYGVTWIARNERARDLESQCDPRGVAQGFGEFLDRERPEVVHVHHLYKLGPKVVAEAKSRGIPVVFTAHDYFAVCHRNTLLRPDLERCTTIGSAEACARCDLAASFLNGLGSLGDYHAGVLSEDLDLTTQGQLGALLSAGDAEREPEWKRTLAQRARLDRRRAEAMAAVDRILAPTRFVAQRLADGGIDPARIHQLPYAIDAQRLRRVAPPRSDPSRGLRFGFLGTIAKHKGVHVLVEAFRHMRGPAELSIFGGSSDRRYAERVRIDASAAGVRWRGAYEWDELPDRLSELDVVVVPSIWFENMPFVILEAFAAGRPVVASAVGGIPELLSSGANGLLVEPGDPGALRAAMERLATEKGLFEHLCRGIPAVQDLKLQAAELANLYATLLPTKTARLASLPECVAPFAQRYRELSELPARELFARVLLGVADLRRDAMPRDPEVNAEGTLAEALSCGTDTENLLREGRRQRAWLKATLEGERAARRVESERAAWLEAQLAHHANALSAAQSALDEGQRAQKSLEEECGWLRDVMEQGRRAQRSLEEERNWLRDILDADARQLEWMQGVLADREAALLERHKEIGAAKIALAARGEELQESARRRAELERELRAGREALERIGKDRRILLDECAWLRGLIGELEKERDWLREFQTSREAERNWLTGLVSHLEKERKWLRELLSSRDREAEWRGLEMRAALGERRALVRRMLAHTALGRRLDAWARLEDGRPEPGDGEA